MKVAELKPGLLVRPKAGKRWVERSNTLCVEEGSGQLYSFAVKPPVDMGTSPAMFIERLDVQERDKHPALRDAFGAQVVILSGRLLAVDGTSWRHIEPLLKH